MHGAKSFLTVIFAQHRRREHEEIFFIFGGGGMIRGKIACRSLLREGIQRSSREVGQGQGNFENPMSSKHRIGIIGSGEDVVPWLRGLARYGNLEIAALADTDESAAQERAARFGIPRAGRPEDVLWDERIESVLSLASGDARYELALEILRHGKHLFAGRMLTRRRKEAREIIKVARDKNLRVGCAPDQFLGAGLQTCRKLIDEGAIGTPIGGAAGFWEFNLSPDASLYQKGGGPLFHRGMYYVAALVFLLGPVRQVTGCARTSFEMRRIPGLKPLPVETPTHIAAVLDFFSGPLVTFTASFDVKAYELPHLEIHGTEGALRLPDPATYGGPVLLRRREDEGWQEVPLEFANDGECHGIGLAEMIAARDAGREHRANERFGYHILDVLHSILDACEGGRHEDLASALRRPEPLPLGLEPGRFDLD